MFANTWLASTSLLKKGATNLIHSARARVPGSAVALHTRHTGRGEGQRVFVMWGSRMESTRVSMVGSCLHAFG
jgi:hypothetical protein